MTNNDSVASALEEASKTASVAPAGVKPPQKPVHLASSSTAPVAAKPVTPTPSQPQVVSRVSTSGGRHWGINVGRYGSRYEAERVLLKVALAEMATLETGLRKVISSKKGFDANFMGLTRETADLACRRLQARKVTCFMIGPS